MERRGFLKNIGLFSAAAGLPAGSLLAAGNNSSNQLKGRVHANGKGLASVVVSDGYNVVLTDSNGNYSMRAHDSAEFVFVSVPAGYEAENDNGLTRFYQKVDKNSNNQQADFALKQLALDDYKHAFILWADPQIRSKDDARQLLSISAPDTVAAIKTLGNVPVHGIGCGDLVWDKPELFVEYNKAVALTGIPFFQAIGNHDMDITTARTDDQSQEKFKSLYGPTYYSFNRGKLHYVVLDDVFFIGQAKRYLGYITENQLQWLEKDLQHVPEDHLLIVVLHIPTNTGDARRRQLKEEEMGGVVSNREHLYNILRPYHVHILSGHTHWHENWEKDNIMEHNHGTVCGAWWTGPVCGDGTPNGYSVYEADGTELSWYYKSTEKPADHQLRLYGRGAVTDKPDAVVANIWNWDSKWKLEWLEDGVSKGTMQPYMGYDPLAYELYEGPEKPKKHPFAEPILTDHLFIAEPSAAAREIVVKATDRFGKTYTEKLVIG